VPSTYFSSRRCATSMKNIADKKVFPGRILFFYNDEITVRSFENLIE